MNRKLSFLFIVIVFGLVLNINFIGCSSKHFPTKNEIDSFFSMYQNQKSKDKRIKDLKNFLQKLSYTKKVQDDYNIQYSMDKMTEIYFETKDEAILIAIDETSIFGGYANFLCEFYRSINKDSVFRNRYRKNSIRKEALERCIGISFSQEELENILTKD